MFCHDCSYTLVIFLQVGGNKNKKGLEQTWMLKEIDYAEISSYIVF